MERITIDNGRKFDFGKTSEEYVKYQDIYPDEILDKLYELGVGTLTLPENFTVRHKVFFTWYYLGKMKG